MIALAACVIAAFTRADNPKPDNPSVTIKLGTAAYYSEPGCLQSVRAITFYRQKYRGWRGKMSLAGPVPRVWYQQCDVLRRRAAEWRDRAGAARVAYGEWYEYNFDWQKWLPWNWRRLGSCETGYGGDPNFEHSVPGFVSAFGITRTNYATDARWAGGPQWSDDPAKRPTPRQQYEAALAHYEHHGDGWGCPGP